MRYITHKRPLRISCLAVSLAVCPFASPQTSRFRIRYTSYDLRCTELKNGSRRTNAATSIFRNAPSSDTLYLFLFCLDFDTSIFSFFTHSRCYLGLSVLYGIKVVVGTSSPFEREVIIASSQSHKFMVQDCRAVACKASTSTVYNYLYIRTHLTILSHPH